MLLNVIAFSQIDKGINYKIDSKTSYFGKQINQCDVIYTTNGLNISSSVKQINDGFVYYKTCNDFGINATIMGSMKTINTNKINKIIFSNGSVRYFMGKEKKNKNVTKPVLSNKNEKVSGWISFSLGSSLLINNDLRSSYVKTRNIASELNYQLRYNISRKLFISFEPGLFIFRSEYIFDSTSIFERSQDYRKYLDIMLHSPIAFNYRTNSLAFNLGIDYVTNVGFYRNVRKSPIVNNWYDPNYTNSGFNAEIFDGYFFRTFIGMNYSLPENKELGIQLWGGNYYQIPNFGSIFEFDYFTFLIKYNIKI